MNHSTLDTLFSGVIAIAGLGIFGTLGYIVRVLSVTKDFPLHRHQPTDRTPGVIIYPKGMAPE